MDRTTVFVVDDDPAICLAFEDLLASVGHVVETFSRAEDFLAVRRPTQAGCLILDVRLPGISGLELQKQLLVARDRIPVVFVTGHGDVALSVQAMKAGAQDFLQKPVREQELLDSVRAALRQDQLIRSSAGESEVALTNYRSLTKREREIMKLVVTGQINKKIAAHVGLSEVTVKIHRAQVMRKMGTASLAELVRVADKVLALTA